ncbi:superoxide dismutase family protein [Salegentibacter sp. JZCK2]|uniref:superoxide dismutase family protein n=1 Tax=Salegentibacter tibetensis TaxID=2873600 RepID=UPI001CCE6C27|nr:superoxide dismutase family protein [Salegentibacter tibetensis]MBZ9729840.1 superoxide dismutase family protein [Salegentibacter tibetensis]
MRSFKLSLAYFAMLALIFTSCSKDEVSKESSPDQDMAILTFGALLTDLETNRSSKAHLDFLGDVPECSELTTTAAYVEIILSQDGENVVGDDGDAYRIDLVDGEMFTEYDSQLELVPGEYSLDYFSVFSSDGTRIWLAPMTSEDNGNDNLAGFVENPLPLNISLGAGVKKYVEVDVLCYDDRLVNLYGYLFFELDETRAIEFCIFGNYCDESGRHYPAEYSVSVWNYENGEMGEQWYSDVYNVVDMNNDGDYAGSPLCFALPDTEGEDEYYFEITLRNSDAYGDVEEEVIRSGIITDGDVRALNDQDGNNQTTDYYHFMEGNCGDIGDSPDLFDDDMETVDYRVNLSELNGSGVSGTAYLSLNGDDLTIKIQASGLEPNMLHPQHIHGLESNENGTCPPSDPGSEAFMAADTDNNGFLSVEEGAPFYGPILLEIYVPIDDYPVADENGDIDFERTFTLGELEFEEEGEVISLSNLEPLENRTIVLHGLTVDGEYDASLPVACGQIEHMD